MVNMIWTNEIGIMTTFRSFCSSSTLLWTIDTTLINRFDIRIGTKNAIESSVKIFLDLDSPSPYKKKSQYLPNKTHKILTHLPFNEGTSNRFIKQQSCLSEQCQHSKLYRTKTWKNIVEFDLFCPILIASGR